MLGCNSYVLQKLCVLQHRIILFLEGCAGVTKTPDIAQSRAPACFVIDWSKQTPACCFRLFCHKSFVPWSVKRIRALSTHRISVQTDIPLYIKKCFNICLRHSLHAIKKFNHISFKSSPKFFWALLMFQWLNLWLNSRYWEWSSPRILSIPLIRKLKNVFVSWQNVRITFANSQKMSQINISSPRYSQSLHISREEHWHNIETWKEGYLKRF